MHYQNERQGSSLANKLKSKNLSSLLDKRQLLNSPQQITQIQGLKIPNRQQFEKTSPTKDERDYITFNNGK